MKISGNPAFLQAWYLKLNDPSANRAFSLRFTGLVSRNGFQRLAETWAVFSQKETSGEIAQFGVKQPHAFSALRSSGEGGVQIGECVMTDSSSRGLVTAKGRSIAWDLRFRQRNRSSFNLIPDFVTMTRVLKATALSTAEDLLVSGELTLDGKTPIELTDAPGMQAYHSGKRTGDSWVWSHCNSFVNEKGEPADFVFEGISASAKLAPGLTTPRVSTFYFRYDGKEYAFRSLMDLLHTRSDSSMTEWNIRADRGDLSFRGEIRAEHRDFAGMVYEDTDGSLLYSSNSKLSAMKVHVYRRGKLEATFISPGTTAFEVVERKKNPYVPTIL